MSRTPSRLVAVVGPTAAGKSAFAMALAEAFKGTILGADSVQVYRGFDIGSAKPTAADQKHVPHRLLDVASADMDFSAADWAKLAREALQETEAAGSLPFVVGGTGFYFRALLQGLIPAPGGNEDVRRRLHELPIEELHARLQKIDAVRAGQVHVNDRFRLVRALEIYETTGRTPSEWAGSELPAGDGHSASDGAVNFPQKTPESPEPGDPEAKSAREPKDDVLWIGVQPDREVLYGRINARVDEMWDAGWPEEVRALTEMGYGETRPMRSVGYAEVHAALYEQLPLAEARDRARQRTRQYAKRQLTWFRANRHVHWFDPDRKKILDEMVLLVSRWLEYGSTDSSN